MTRHITIFGLFSCIFISSFCAPADPTRGAAPTIEFLAGRHTIHLPSGLSKSVEDRFPGFRVPTDTDLEGFWSERTAPHTLPFITWGDFTGDGSTDVTIILLGAKEWRLVVFTQTKAGRYETSTISGGSIGLQRSSVPAPKDRAISTVKKGTSIFNDATDESGESKRLETKFAVDGIQLDLEDATVWFRWDGRRFETIEYSE